MFGHKDYVSGGYSDEVMGDLSDYLGLAASFLGGPAGAILDGAQLSSGGTFLPSPLPSPFGGDDAPTGESTAKITAPSGVKVRAQPNENSSEKTRLASGATVTVIKTGFPPTTAAPKGWTQVRTSTGIEGYITTEWLSISTPTSASSGNTSTSSAIVPAPASLPKPAGSSSSILDNKLLLVGGGVALVAIVAAVALGGKKKKKAA